jgi:uncharacterized UBP type Zn finger protein
MWYFLFLLANYTICIKGVRWNLLAAVEHSGATINSAHYFAWIRANTKEWWIANDSDCWRIQPELKENIYRLCLLFFERVP